MKLSALAAVGVLACAGLSSAAIAQQSRPTTTENVTVLELGGPTPESAADARKEAAAALAQAKQDCRQEQGRSAQQDCLRAARDDYNQMMASAGGNSRRNSRSR